MSNVLKKFLEEVEFNREWLETTEGDEVECISIENLKGILKRYEIKEKAVKLTAQQDKEWEKIFETALNAGKSESEADKEAFEVLSQKYPELKHVKRIK